MGVGNVLRRDDGFGVRAAEAMARLPLGGEVEVYEAGTAAAEMAAVLERRQRVVVADAATRDVVAASLDLGPERFHVLPLSYEPRFAGLGSSGAAPREEEPTSLQEEVVALGGGLQRLELLGVLDYVLHEPVHVVVEAGHFPTLAGGIEAVDQFSRIRSGFVILRR